MTDKNKIIIMTKLAVYDKHIADKDRRVNDYFLHDYIYKNNMWTRFAVITGSVIVIFFHMLHRIFNESVDVLTLDYPAELKRMGLFILAVAVVYTVIGSFKSYYDYRQSQNRIKEYTRSLQKLAKKTPKEEPAEEDTDVIYGDHIIYTRDTD